MPIAVKRSYTARLNRTLPAFCPMRPRRRVFTVATTEQGVKKGFVVEAEATPNYTCDNYLQRLVKSLAQMWKKRLKQKLY
uniref:Uncharacterized protein n=1 Tax=Anopheles funestus TaxID=62324 RepID=A0A182RVC9_ANOFN